MTSVNMSNIKEYYQNPNFGGYNLHVNSTRHYEKEKKISFWLRIRSQ